MDLLISSPGAKTALYRQGGAGLNFSRGHVAPYKKERGIGGDVQVEIPETVHQEPQAADKRRELQGGGERTVGGRETRQGVREKRAEKPQAAQPAEKARFR